MKLRPRPPTVLRLPSREETKNEFLPCSQLFPAGCTNRTWGLKAICTAVDCKTSRVWVTRTSPLASETTLRRYIAALDRREMVAVTFLALSSFAGSHDLLWFCEMLMRNGFIMKNYTLLGSIASASKTPVLLSAMAPSEPHGLHLDYTDVRGACQLCPSAGLLLAGQKEAIVFNTDEVTLGIIADVFGLQAVRGKERLHIPWPCDTQLQPLRGRYQHWLIDVGDWYYIRAGSVHIFRNIGNTECLSIAWNVRLGETDSDSE